MNNPCTSSVFVNVHSVCMLFLTVTFMFLIMFDINYLVHASYPLTLDFKFLFWFKFLYSRYPSFPSIHFHNFSQWNLFDYSLCEIICVSCI
jgi:hypothetical protein